MDEIPVVTCFLRCEGRVLLCRRSEEVGSYQGLWGAVAGHVATANGDPRAPERSPIDAAREEIREETGVEEATLVRQGERFPVEDTERGTRWLVTPFLFDVDDRAIETDAETVAVEWVHAPDVRRRQAVPDLWKSYDRVRPRVATVRDDTTHGAAFVSRCALEVLRDEAALARDGADFTDADRPGNDWDGLASLARTLLTARPSMAVVANRINRAMAAATVGENGTTERTPAAVETATSEGIDRAVNVDAEAATLAADELPARVATLSRSGTVQRALEGAQPGAILVAESRPGGEGVAVAERLATALPAAEITLTTDAAFAFELAAWDAGALLVGADRVLPDGSVVNKVGTRSAALGAPEECQVFVVASTDKVATDDAVDLEAREATELYQGDAPLSVENPTFDVTPADAIDAVLTERGSLSTDEVAVVAEQHRTMADW